MATTVKKLNEVKSARGGLSIKKSPVTKVGADHVSAQPIVKDSTANVLARFINKNLKVSPRKLRLVVTAVKKLDPATAITRLKFTNSSGARILCKCLEDAVASAKHNYNLLPSSMYFTEFRVDEGMKIKRMDKSHGSRFARGIIQKRHSRLVIVLSGTIQG